MKKPDYLSLPAFFALFFVHVFLFSACKSKPATEMPLIPEIPELSIEVSEPSVVFERVEAEEPVHLRLYFTLNAENPFPLSGDVNIESWRAEINGKPAAHGFSLVEPKNQTLHVSPGFNTFPLQLNMDVGELKNQGLAPADNYDVKLILKLTYLFDAALLKDRESISHEISGYAIFPGVQPPEFSITSIAILQAELINTRFRVSIKIDNPNPFSVDLAAFSYVLYGNDRRWADGNEKNIIQVKGKSSLTGDLFLIMNFIDMKRDLLDQIIALKDVNYRFTGEAQVNTNVEYLPKFATSFNLSGYSKVLEK